MDHKDYKILLKICLSTFRLLLLLRSRYFPVHFVYSHLHIKHFPQKKTSTRNKYGKKNVGLYAIPAHLRNYVLTVGMKYLVS
jgi:hypothetical protein